MQEFLRREDEAKVKVKRECLDDNDRPRKVSRPNRQSEQLEIDEDGRVRANPTPTKVVKPEVIELD